MNIIHLLKTCSAFDYKDIIEVYEYFSDPKTKGNAIKITYKSKQLYVPLANIACIEVRE